VDAVTLEIKAAGTEEELCSTARKGEVRDGMEAAYDAKAKVTKCTPDSEGFVAYKIKLTPKKGTSIEELKDDVDQTSAAELSEIVGADVSEATVTASDDEDYEEKIAVVSSTAPTLPVGTIVGIVLAVFFFCLILILGAAWYYYKSRNTGSADPRLTVSSTART